MKSLNKKIGPNILIIMADQLSALALSCYGNKVIKTPNIDKIAKNGIVFENNYSTCPLCVPSRASLLSGNLPSKIEVYDNGAEFKASIPTFVHFLRSEGYYTCSAGKMHFIGPDQLHGFEDRVTTEIYPADFSWTSNWETDARFVKSNENSSIDSALDADAYAWNMQMDYDEEVFYQGRRQIYEIARVDKKNPFLLFISFTHPHDPFITTKKYWDLYSNDEVDMPKVPPIPLEEQDPHSRYLYEMYNMDKITNILDIKNARHGYYGMISYVDEKIGKLLEALEETGLDKNTVVIFTSDHGEMLGERGMWYKKTFFESSIRVPLILNFPLMFKPERVTKNTSLVDIMPTILDICNCNIDNYKNVLDLDGHTLLDVLNGNSNNWDNIVYAEQTDSGTLAPRLMVKKDKYKYVWSEAYPPLLYNLYNDPHELKNLSGLSEYKELENMMFSLVQQKWDTKNIKDKIIKHQKKSILVSNALSKGRITYWEIGSTVNFARRYVRYGNKFPDVDRDCYVPYKTINRRNK